MKQLFSTRWSRGGVMLGCFLLQPAAALAQSDTGHVRPLFTYRDAILAGTFVAATFAVRPLDLHYAEVLQDSSTQDSRRLHKIGQFVREVATPGSGIIGASMYLAGRLTKNDRLASLGLHGSEALLVGEGVASVLKGTIGRQRPYVTPRNPQSFGFLRGFGDGDAYRSFPSGHTVAAFAAAAAVTGETSQWWPSSRFLIGPVLYTGAALTGASRMFDNRHWASDVVVGAAIGTFAGLKVVRYHSSHPDNAVDRWLLRASIIPVGTDGHSLSLSIAPAPRFGEAPRAP